MKDDLDYNINETDEPILSEKEALKRKKITIILSSIIGILTIIIIVGIVLYFTGKNDENNTNNNNNHKEEEIIPQYTTFMSISTAENKLIRNSFIKGRENYNSEIEDIVGGKDYEETDRDNFDLCIPGTAAVNKNNYKTIVLMIHGGGWVGGEKADALQLCKAYVNYGFIIATMSYTLLNGRYKEYNIFRIMDEITAVLKNIKKFLKEKGYDENKLEVIIAGGSAGAHLSLLYSYMIKNPPIPIKFILDMVGPVTLEPEYWLTIKPGLEPLIDIEPDNITEAIKENKLIHMNGNETGVNMNNIFIMKFMNAWLGKPLNDSFNEIFSDVDKKIINTENKIYKERMNKVKYGFPITYVTKESIPTLCVYGGKDEEIGTAQYAELKKAFKEKNNEKNITLCYFRYGKHDAFFNASESESNKFSKTFGDYIAKYLNSIKNKN